MNTERSETKKATVQTSHRRSATISDDNKTRKHVTTKSSKTMHGGHNNTSDGRSSNQTHHKFIAVPQTAYELKTTQREKVTIRLESDGNRRPSYQQKTRHIGILRIPGTDRLQKNDCHSVKDQIRELLDYIYDEDERREEDKFPDSTEDMLKCIKSSIQHYKEEIKWYKQEKKSVELEIQKLTQDVSDYGRFEEENDCIEKELFMLVGAESEIVKTIRTIRRALKSQQSEKEIRLKQLENELSVNRKTFGEILKLFNEDHEQKQNEGCIEQSDFDGINECKVIVDEIKRWKTDRQQLVSHAETLLKDISTIITREPFCLTWSNDSDFKSLQGLTPEFQEVLSDVHNIKLRLEDYRKCFKEKYVEVEALTELRELLKGLQKEIENLKDEKGVLLNRLSKIAGANLTDNNPNIADLSDPNRATKLGEQFSELYDNGWTNAFDVLEMSDEKECIQYLLNIIVESYRICGDISNMQKSTLTTVLNRPTERLSNKKMYHDKDITLSKLQSRALSDVRKLSADLSTQDVKLYIAAKNVDWVKHSALKSFTMSCVELCWFMHLQSPPVYLDASVETNLKFDTNKYKPYTRSGKKVDFVVWPSLLLHQGGHMLCKGVAQGK